MSTAVKRETGKAPAAEVSNKRRSTNNKAGGNGSTAGVSSTELKRLLASHKRGPMRKRVTGGRSNSTLVLALRPQFPFLLRLPPAKEIYPTVQVSGTVRSAEPYTVSSSKLFSVGDTVIAGMYLRQLRASCAVFDSRRNSGSDGGCGRVSSSSGIVSSGNSNNGNSNTGGSSSNTNNNNSNNFDSSCLEAGVNFYHSLYEMQRWLFLGGGYVRGERPKTAKNAWQAFFCKKNRLWRTLLSALDSELIMIDRNAGAGLLTVLYNLLRATTGGRRRRAVKMCLRLRLPQQCASILEMYESVLMATVGVHVSGSGGSSSSITSSDGKGFKGSTILHSDDLSPRTEARQSYGCIRSLPFSLTRIVECVAVLLGFCSTDNSKFLTAVRRTNFLSLLLHAADLLFVVLENNVRCMASILGSAAAVTGVTSETGILCGSDSGKRIEFIIEDILPICDAFLHVILSLYQFSVSSHNAELMAPQGAVLCLKIGWMVHAFLTTMTPLRSFYHCDQHRQREHQQQPQYQYPALCSWKNSLETLTVWSMELLCRICTTKTGSKPALEAARQMRAVYLLCTLSMHSAVSAEIVLSSLNLVNALTARDSGCRDQLQTEVGGLSALLTGVVSAADEAGRTVAHWQKLYLSLHALFGFVTLPGEMSPAQRGGCSIRTVPTPRIQQTFHTATTPIAPDEDGGVSGVPSILPVDQQPDVFSPELRRPTPIESSPFVPPSQLPWRFTDVPPPRSCEITANMFPDVVTGVVDTNARLFPPLPPAPLQPPAAQTRLRVLRRLILRLGTSLSHMDRIVYERPSLQARVDEEETTNDAADTVGCVSVLSESKKSEIPPGFLKFGANFENGNLQRAIAVEANEYDLVLCTDTNTNCHVQWFCFSVEEYTPGAEYHFNILNMEKPGSTFNEGQQPVMLYVDTSPTTGKETDVLQWRRCGHDICYFQNLYQRPERCTTTTTISTTTAVENTTQTGSGSTGEAKKNGNGERTISTAQKMSKKSEKKKSNNARSSPNEKGGKVLCCYSLSFTAVFPTKKGRVFLANCFPYTYTNLLEDVRKWQLRCSTSATLSVQELCKTPGGLPIPVLTISSPPNSATGSNIASGGAGIGSYDTNTTNTTTTTAINDNNNNNNNNNNNIADNGNKVLDYTSDSFLSRTIEKRPVCIVTARVHPGESNSSWMMRGLVEYLLHDDEQGHSLRSRFVWKIIPMINPDGVVLGNHRCSLSGADLNRDFADPKPSLNPAIYSLKRLTQHIIEREKRHVALFADFHGHSRAKNFLIYGCTPRTKRDDRKPVEKSPATNKSPLYPVASTATSVVSARKTLAGASGSLCANSISLEKLLPLLLSTLSPAFAMSQCSFTVQKGKKNTGRVVMYQQFGIRMSYTLEATMMGGVSDGVGCYHNITLQKSTTSESRSLLHKQQQRQDENVNEVGEEEEEAEAEEEEAPHDLYSQEISYNTCHYENMGALLAHGVELLAGDDDGMNASDKEAMERAWALLPSLSGVDASMIPKSSAMGGSYALATRKERCSDVSKTKKEKTATTVNGSGATLVVGISAEQRREVQRALFVRPRPSSVQPTTGSTALLAIDNDDDDDDDDDDDHDDTVPAVEDEDEDEEDDDADEEDEEDDNEEDDEDGNEEEEEELGKE